jgi:hypothetical protein
MWLINPGNFFIISSVSVFTVYSCPKAFSKISLKSFKTGKPNCVFKYNLGGVKGNYFSNKRKNSHSVIESLLFSFSFLLLLELSSFGLTTIVNKRPRELFST